MGRPTITNRGGSPGSNRPPSEEEKKQTFTVAMTMAARIHFSNVIRVQRQKPDSNWLTLVEAHRKFLLDDDDLDQFKGKPCGACGQGRIWNKPAIRDADMIVVAFNKPEIRALLAVIDGWSTATVDDAEWLASLESDLRQALKPVN